MGAYNTVYDNEYNYWSNQTESKLKKEIKHEKSAFRKKDLMQIYNELKRIGHYKNNK